MSTKSEILSLLSKEVGTPVSGQELAETLGVSRNAVWKAIKSLREQGFAIESLQGTGYRLLEAHDILCRDTIESALDFPCTVHLLEKIDSTNNYAKKIDTSNGIHLVTACEQTGGRGRLGREFFSPSDKGIYMSIAFSPDFSIERALFITTLSSVAVCLAIEELTELHPKIKWVNDVYLDGKKLVGILTEAESNFENGKIEKIVVGIGINCFESEFPDELKERVTCLSLTAKKPFTRNALIAAVTKHFFDLLNNFSCEKILREYKKRSFILGEQILIFNPAIAKEIGRSEEKLYEGIRARAIDIDENGGLVVEFLEGRLFHEMKTLTSGEVTVRKA